MLISCLLLVKFSICSVVMLTVKGLHVQIGLC